MLGVQEQPSGHRGDDGRGRNNMEGFDEALDSTKELKGYSNGKKEHEQLFEKEMYHSINVG